MHSTKSYINMTPEPFENNFAGCSWPVLVFVNIIVEVHLRLGLGLLLKSILGDIHVIVWVSVGPYWQYWLSMLDHIGRTIELGHIGMTIQVICIDIII